MEWVYLIIAGLLEIGWAIGLKYTDGFTRLWPTVITLILMIASLFFLALAVQKIPLGTGYAIWTGIGAVGTVILGMIYFDEPTNGSRILFIAIVILGILGLKLSGMSDNTELKKSEEIVVGSP